MNQDKKNKTLVIIAAILISLIMIAIALLIWDSPKENKPYDPKEPKTAEEGGPNTIFLKNTETLVKLLLPKQYDAVKNSLNNFVRLHYGLSPESVTIGDEPQVGGDNIIRFSASVDGVSNSTFTVIVDKSTEYDKLKLSVPEKAFSETTQVYRN